MVINPMADSDKLTKQLSDDDQSHGWQQETLPNNPVMVINSMDDCNKLTKQVSDGNEPMPDSKKLT